MSGKALVLTDNRISKLKFTPNGPSLQRHWDAIQPGLHVTVYPAPRNHRQTGKKTLSVRYDQADGRQRIKKIGEFPSLSIEEARKLAAELRGRGTLPITFSEAYRDILKNLDRLPMGRNSKATLKVFTSGMKTHILPVISKAQIEDVGTNRLLRIIETKVKAGKYGSAQTALAAINNFYRNVRALSPEYRALKNPLTGVEVYIPKFKAKNKVLSTEQLRAIWNTENPVLRLLMLTGQRQHQMIELEWNQIQGDLIRFHKMKRPGTVHMLPITSAILAVLDSIPRTGERVFNFRTVLPESEIRTEMNHAVVGSSPHMLRHTFATLGIENGLSYEGIARVLHHSLPGMTAHYSRDAQALDIKRETLEKWHRYLARVNN